MRLLNISLEILMEYIKMRTDKQRVFDYLSWNPGKFARWTSEDLKSINNEEKFHYTVDKYTNMLIANTSNPLEVAAVIHYWLVKAKLPLDGSQSGYAEKLHKVCGSIILDSKYQPLTKYMEEILE